MSSRGRLVVHIAENGNSFEYGCDENTLVNDVQRFLESVSGTKINDQLLICLNMQLETKNPLSTYKLPSSDDREVFLFNKSMMRSNSLPPTPESIKLVEIPDPPSSSSSSNPHPLDDSPDPALQALPSYARIFSYHYQLGHAYYSRTEAKLEKCVKLLREQKVQDRAMAIVRDYLNDLYGMLLKNYSNFKKRYWHQNRRHSSIMVNFGKDMEKLRYCRLHPALQTNGRNCLLDFLKEDQLSQKRGDECRDSLKRFEKKVSEFEKDFEELKIIGEELFSSKASSLVMDSERAIKDHYRYIHEQKTIMQSFKKDVNTVKKLIDDCLSNQLTASCRPHDAVSALGLIYEGQFKNCLPKLKEYERTISRLLDFCRDKKNNMNIFLYKYMQKIAYVQYTMKGLRCRFSIFNEAMNCQSDQFHVLSIVHGMGSAYRACLAEIVRRKSYSKLYMGMAGRLAEKLATNRDVEVRRRDEFLRSYGLYIPQDVFTTMGLYDNPSMLQVNIAPFDCNLLDIDISDLKLYSPEFIFGSFKDSFNENAADFDELAAGDDELFEIAGTSKMEVENVKLKADLASAIARICTLSMEFDTELHEDSKMESAVREAADKTSEALRMKDEYEKQLRSLLKDKQMECDSYEKQVTELEQKLYEVLSKVDQKPELSVPDLVECVSDETMNHDGGDIVGELQDVVADNSNESKLNDETEEVSNSNSNSNSKLENEVNLSEKLLKDSLMTSALTHFCESETREEEYIAAVKTRTIFERFRAVISSSGDIVEFPNSLRLLSESLANSGKDDDVGECIQLLADKVGLLSNHNAELIEKYTKEKKQLNKELDENKELAATLEKQANKEKISFGSLEVKEIAAFVLNSATGHYEAIHDNRGCGNNYHLSAESVSLLTDHLPNRPSYVIGKIVHIERRTMATPEQLNSTSTSVNQCDLTMGCEYFIVTVTRLPDDSTSDHSSSTPAP